MSTFADFALLAAVPSYGGAEILRAQRILPMGPGPRVHLAVLGRNDAVARRVIAAAHAGSAVLHPALARIFEVCRFDGVSYAVADPTEGLDLSALMSRTKRPAAFELALAVAASLGRVGVSLHDAAGPGSRGGPAGFASVVSGGLALEVVFLESSGAVRLRPLSAAGIDPDLPSAMRAPEEAISMAADVYSLGRLLMALLSGDVSGLTMPRLSSSSTLPTLLAQMVLRRPEQRPHLHEVVTQLEQALRERNVASADQAVRAALQGPYKQFVVDPGLGLDASPHIAHELRMRLPYVYAAIERLWPSANPGFAPAPPVFAALAAPAVPQLGAGGGDDVSVFSEPKKRRRARTAATLRISADEMAAAVAAADAAGPLVDAPAPRQQRPTAKTVLIPTAEMIKALPHGGASPNDNDDDDGFEHSGRRPSPSRPQHTVLFDEGFSPFSPPPPRAAPIPFDDDVDDDDPNGATRERELPPAESVFSAPPPPPPPPKSSPERRPPRPPTLAALAVFDNGGDDEAVDDDPELAPIEGSLFQRLQAAEAAEAAAAAALTRAKPTRAPSTPPAPSREIPLPARRQVPTVEAIAAERELLRSVLDDDDLSEDDNGAIDASDEDDAGFLSRSPQAPLATFVGPPPQLSESGAPSGATVPRKAVSRSTLAEEPREPSRPVPRPSRPVTAPAIEAPIALSEEGDFAAAFALAFAADPAPPTSPPAAVVDDIDEIEEVEAIEDDVPEVIDDAAAFVMVGEAGAVFAAEDNPFDQSTRIYAAQALQQARNELDEEGEEGLDGVDDDLDGAADLDLDGDLDGDIDAALDGALSFGGAPAESPWAAPMSRTGPGAIPSSAASREGSAEDEPFEPRTELVEVGAWRSSLEEKPALGFVAEAKRSRGGRGNVPADQSSLEEKPAPVVDVASDRVTLDDRAAPGRQAARAAMPSQVPQTMVSVSPLHSGALDPADAPRTTVGSLPDEAPVVDVAIPRHVTGVYTPPRGAAATSELVVEAAVGATVALNGTVVGVVDDGGRFGVEVAGDARVVVRVTLPAHAPWSSVVTVQGRPRVRVKATLQPR